MPILNDFIMAMRSRGFTGTADPTDNFTPCYPLTGPFFQTKHMCVQGLISITMIYHNMITIAAGMYAGCFYNPCSGCINWSAGRSGEINTSMQFDSFINRVNTVTETGSNPFQVLIADRLNSRCGGEKL